jgi:Ca2+/H+ antiporter, TMEM165/GDT1 family
MRWNALPIRAQRAEPSIVPPLRYFRRAPRTYLFFRGYIGDLAAQSHPAGVIVMNWTAAAPAITTAFLGSLVEAVEALTIVLAVATVRGWRPSLLGAGGGLVLLALIVLVFGPLLNRVPVHLIQFAVGLLLLLFGMRWLRKAILRAAGIIPLHDETRAFASETASLRERARHDTRLDWFAGVASFKAVVLEGAEVVFIVIAVGAGGGLLLPASLAAFAACLLVVVIGFAIHRPLTRVPENTLKFAVGVLLSAFGVFWTGESLGVAWPGEDLAIVGFAVLFLVVAFAGVALARRETAEALL